MIKHFCDLCGNEIEDKRIRIRVTGEEEWDEGRFHMSGNDFINKSCEICPECCEKLAEIISFTGKESHLSWFDRLKNFIKNRKESKNG